MKLSKKSVDPSRSIYEYNRQTIEGIVDRLIKKTRILGEGGVEIRGANIPFFGVISDTD